MVEQNSGELERGEWTSKDLAEEELAEAASSSRPAEEGGILEPYVGMEFDSEDDARRFYSDYAKRIGFVVRVMQRRRSEIDGRTLARRLGCNKQGFSPNTKGKTGPSRKPRPSAREGCKATILFKLEKSGKWTVTRFVKEHNHPLVVTPDERTNVHDKDKKIQELARELRRQEELCAAYRERLISLLTCIESQSEELSSKVVAVVENVKKAEAEALDEVLMLSAPST
ncbi:protein FAR1-RELATED SEQUENCE 2 [Andrographis paniculata]|uniref:protein FAR1-RELATED SEQUENCE 2 n=1 Tax=Andrographis paniculata TaxID=175694 RepID=UPI0021E7E76A|nr:protein FAR1-RELATED SEQUENCE 2 [Andrographis paniculata]